MKATCDILEHLSFLCGEQLLRSANGSHAGEFDAYRTLRKGEFIRCIGAGLISANGAHPEQIAQAVAERGGPIMTADETVAWYVRTAIQGLDMIAAAKRDSGEFDARRADYEDLDVVSSWAPPAGPMAAAPSEDPPAWVHDWLARTVHGPKLDFLLELMTWRWYGADEPATPSAPWGAKCRAKFDARCKAGKS